MSCESKNIREGGNARTPIEPVAPSKHPSTSIENHELRVEQLRKRNSELTGGNEVKGGHESSIIKTLRKS